MASPNTLAKQATVGNFTTRRLKPLAELDKAKVQNVGELRVPQPTDVFVDVAHRLSYFDDGSLRWNKPKKTRAERKAERRLRRQN